MEAGSWRRVQGAPQLSAPFGSCGVRSPACDASSTCHPSGNCWDALYWVHSSPIPALRSHWGYPCSQAGTSKTGNFLQEDCNELAGKRLI